MTLVTTSPLDTAHPGFRADIDKGDVIMNKNYDSRYSFTADTIGPHLMMSAVRLDCRLSRNDSYLILREVPGLNVMYLWRQSVMIQFVPGLMLIIIFSSCSFIISRFWLAANVIMC